MNGWSKQLRRNTLQKILDNKKDILDNEKLGMDELFPSNVIQESKSIATQLKPSDNQNVNYLQKLHDEVPNEKNLSPEAHDENAWQVVRTALRQFTSEIPDLEAYKKNIPPAEELYTKMKPYLEKAIAQSKEQEPEHAESGYSR